MARHRLHGATQKRRQKKSTRLLKLRSSAQRPQATGVGLPFERSPELDPQDIEFLEAMRDLSVRRLPGAGGASVRQEAIAQAHFASDQDNARQFQRAMAELGVAPLGQAPPAGSHFAPEAPESGAPRPQRAAGQDAEWEGKITDAPRARAAMPPPAAPQSKAPSSTMPEPTRFEEPEPGGRWMEEALRGAVLDLNEKFQGIPPRRKGRPRRESVPELEPDAQLDLHGKTLEAALRAVSAFLRQAHGQRLRHVLLITGKGLGSGPQGPVLRQAVQHWLERNGAPYVKDFQPAAPRHGGEGAWWVWMK